jgi:uroporphyrinogen decarboxylase
VEGLVKAAKKEALIVLTLYSPYMECNNMVGQETVARHIEQDPEAFKSGIERMTESIQQFVRACIRLGLDGFYTSTQGGEKARLSNPTLFDTFIAPYDRILMDEINRECVFNILHVCDYWEPYSDITRFAGWPGQVVSAGLELTDGERLTSRQVANLFNRPFMGGLDRKGVISTGTPEQIRQAVLTTIQNAPERFILGADCTVLPNTPWDNLRLAIRTAHEYKR